MMGQTRGALFPGRSGRPSQAPSTTALPWRVPKQPFVAPDSLPNAGQVHPPAPGHRGSDVLSRAQAAVFPRWPQARPFRDAPRAASSPRTQRRAERARGARPCRPGLPTGRAGTQTFRSAPEHVSAASALLFPGSPLRLHFPQSSALGVRRRLPFKTGAMRTRPCLMSAVASRRPQGGVQARFGRPLPSGGRPPASPWPSHQRPVGSLAVPAAEARRASPLLPPRGAQGSLS